jgi:hypothetical protein
MKGVYALINAHTLFKPPVTKTPVPVLKSFGTVLFSFQFATPHKHML